MPEPSNRLSAVMSGSGSISATPRNKLLGLLADGIGGVGDFMEHKDGLLPMSILSQALGIKPIARTLNELSYGGSLGTGSGMTWKPKADTVDALMAVAPLAMATPGLVNTAAAAVGKRLEPSVTRIVNNTMAKGGKPAQLLQDLATGTQSPMVRIQGRGQIPETRADVNKLADRLQGLLDDVGVSYTHDKSSVSPARYFELDNPRTLQDELGPERFKARISDHRNVHGADISVDPATGGTFEEMLQSLREIGVPVGNRVKPVPASKAVIDDATLEKVYGMPINEMQARGFDLEKVRSKYQWDKKGYWTERK